MERIHEQFVCVNGQNNKKLARMAEKGVMTRLYRGAYVDAAWFAAKSPVDQYRIRAEAVLAVCADYQPFGVTAAILAGADVARIPAELHFSCASANLRKTTIYGRVRLHTGAAAFIGDEKADAAGAAAFLNDEKADGAAVTIVQTAVCEPAEVALPVINRLLAIAKKDYGAQKVYTRDALTGGSFGPALRSRDIVLLLQLLDAEGVPAARKLMTYRPLGFDFSSTDIILERAIALLGGATMRRAKNRKRALLTLLLATDAAESVAESLFFAKCFKLGYRLPIPQLNLFRETNEGDSEWLARVDGAWVADSELVGQIGYRSYGARDGRSLCVDKTIARELLLFEFDGKVKFFDLASAETGGTEAALYLAHRRQDRLTNLGCRFVRISWADLMNDTALGAILAEADVPKI